MDISAPLPGLAGTEGMAEATPAPPCTLVIFGAAGDLTRRLLMPSLYNLAQAHLLNDAFKVIGVDRADGTDESYRETLTQATQTFVGQKGDGEAWSRVRDRLNYHKGDLNDPSAY